MLVPAITLDGHDEFATSVESANFHRFGLPATARLRYACNLNIILVSRIFVDDGTDQINCVTERGDDVAHVISQAVSGSSVPSISVVHRNFFFKYEHNRFGVLRSDAYFRDTRKPRILGGGRMKKKSRFFTVSLVCRVGILYEDIQH